MNLVTIQNKPTNNFQENLNHLETLILETPENSFILAPELCLTSYAYENIEQVLSLIHI